MLESICPGSMFQTALVGMIVGLVVYWYLKKRRYNMPPGPWKLPILGNALQLGSDKRYHIKFYEWSKKYGPVITVGFGPIQLVVVNTIDSAMEVLVKKSTDFSGRQESPSIKEWSDGYKDIALAQYGPMWKLQRRISVKALRYYMLGNALEERLHTALQTSFPVLEEMKGAFDPGDVINFLIVNILMGLCFQGQYEYGNSEIKCILNQENEANMLFNDFIPEDLFPPLQYIYQSKTLKKIKELKNALVNDFIGARFYKQKQTFDRDNIRHFTDTLLLAREETEAEEGDGQGSLTDEHLIQTLSDIFFAGIDTSRVTLQFALLHMVAFPDIQNKVQEELDREIDYSTHFDWGTNTNATGWSYRHHMERALKKSILRNFSFDMDYFGKDRLPGVEDRSNLAYTEAVLQESMRVATVAPSGVFHRAMVDTEISGYKIPKDTLVMINHWALHHDPKAWDEVNKFKPERYLDENGRLGPKPPNWIPFSAGKRVCLGEFVAKPELHLLFAALMQRFTWSVESGVHVNITPEGSSLLSTVPSYKVLIQKRM